MAFPEVAVLVDNFNRASIGSQWVNINAGALIITAAQTEITSNDAANNSNMSALTTKAYKGYVEAHATISTKGVNGEWTALGLYSDLTYGSTDGYAVYISRTGATAFAFWRLDNGSFTQLGSSETYTSATGHRWGLAYNPGDRSITGYIDTGGGFSAFTPRFDSTYVGPFYPGFDISVGKDINNGWAADDLFAGDRGATRRNALRPRPFAPGIAR